MLTNILTSPQQAENNDREDSNSKDKFVEWRRHSLRFEFQIWRITWKHL